jgi:hypothetical protein
MCSTHLGVWCAQYKAVTQVIFMVSFLYSEEALQVIGFDETH